MSEVPLYGGSGQTSPVQRARKFGGTVLPNIKGGAVRWLGTDLANYLTEMCSGSEAGSYLRLIDSVYHSTLGLRVIKKKKTSPVQRARKLWTVFGTVLPNSPT